MGVVASNLMVNARGMDGHTAQKMERFIDLCCIFNIPMALLVDVSSLMIGVEAEKTRTVRYGMAAVMATSEATVPKVQIIMRNSYGIGGGVFNSVGGLLHPDVWFGWFA